MGQMHLINARVRALCLQQLVYMGPGNGVEIVLIFFIITPSAALADFVLFISEILGLWGWKS
jgi:hypothetical protein